MTEQWDDSVDVLVAGSGAAGLTAAIAAADRGLEVLVVESTARWGGTTSISGGGLWMPANPLMICDGSRTPPPKPCGTWTTSSATSDRPPHRSVEPPSSKPPRRS